MKVAKIAAKTSLMKAMPRSYSSPDANGYYYDPQEIFSVIKATDAYGRHSPPRTLPASSGETKSKGEL